MNAARPVGPAVLICAGVAAVVAAAMARWAVNTGPRIGTVRLDDLATEFVAAAVRGETSGGEAAEASRIWGLSLEAALDRVAESHGVVLVAPEAVLAGAADYTAEVRAWAEYFAAIRTDRRFEPFAERAGLDAAPESSPPASGLAP